MLKLITVVHFDEHRHAESLRTALEFEHFGPCEAGGDEQDAVSAPDARFRYLIGLDHEILAQRGQHGRCASRLEMLLGALKKLFVREDGHAGGAGAFVTLCDRSGIEVGTQHAFRRARLLDLGNDRGAASRDLRAHGADEIARWLCGLGAGFYVLFRQTLLCRGDLATLDGEDALQDGQAALFSFLVNAMKSSSFCFAAPDLMIWLARCTPAFSESQRPAT